VKSAGKAVPDIYNENGENLFPSFVTYRELVDGKYWFPSYTKSDDYLHFSTDSIHVVETVDYINYKRFGAESRIIFDGKQIGSDEPQQSSDQREGPNQQPSAPPTSARAKCEAGIGVARAGDLGCDYQERGFNPQSHPHRRLPADQRQR